MLADDSPNLNNADIHLICSVAESGLAVVAVGDPKAAISVTILREVTKLLMFSFWKRFRITNKPGDQSSEGDRANIRPLEIPSATDAARQSANVNSNEERDRNASAVKRRQEAVESTIRRLDGRALEIRSSIGNDVQEAISAGKSSLYYSLISIPVEITLRRNEARGFSLDQIASSAPELRILLNDLRRMGYRIELTELGGEYNGANGSAGLWVYFS